MTAYVQRVGQICAAMLIVLWLVFPAVEWWALVLGLVALLAPVVERAPTVRLPRWLASNPAPVDDPTEYLTDADREWLTGHGWEPPPAAPAPPKRAAWQASLDREIARRAESLRVQTGNVTRRHNAVRIETGTRRPKYLTGHELTAACRLCDWREPVDGRDDALVKLQRHHRAEHPKS